MSDKKRPHGNGLVIEQDLFPYERLANAIIVQACTDYRSVYLRDVKHQRRYKKVSSSTTPTTATISEIERFFRSQWFHQLTGIDPEFLIEQLRKELEG